jgi:hypothetical protein
MQSANDIPVFLTCVAIGYIMAGVQLLVQHQARAIRECQIEIALGEVIQTEKSHEVS